MQSTPQWNWSNGVNNFHTSLYAAIDSIKLNLPKYNNKRSKSIEILEFKEFTDQINEKQFDRASTIRIEGVYSEYPLVMNLSSLFPSSFGLRAGDDISKFLSSPLVTTPNFALPIRLKPIRGFGLAALYDNSANGIFDNFVPLFYRSKLFENQKKLSGKRVKISGNIVLLSNRWTNLYVAEKIPKFGNDFTPYIGLLVNDIEVVSSTKSFLVDLWRFDHFKMNNYEEECLELYAKFTPLDWPDTAAKLRNHLLSTTISSIITGIVPWFGIVPRINIANSHKLKSARDFLEKFYLNTYQLSNSKKLIPMYSIGRGLCKPYMLQNCDCIYQYDQVNPVLEQNFKLRLNT